MVLGMLCCGSQTAQQQLAEEAGALQELLALLKQQEDMDCKVGGDSIVVLTSRACQPAMLCHAAIHQQPVAHSCQGPATSIAKRLLAVTNPAFLEPTACVARHCHLELPDGLNHAQLISPSAV